MSAPQMQGIKHVSAPGYRDDPLQRIAIALETLVGCTGWIDPITGMRQHDGETCPVHEGQDDTPDAHDEVGLLERLRNWWYLNVG